MYRQTARKDGHGDLFLSAQDEEASTNADFWLRRNLFKGRITWLEVDGVFRGKARIEPGLLISLCLFFYFYFFCASKAASSERDFLMKVPG